MRVRWPTNVAVDSPATGQVDATRAWRPADASQVQPGLLARQAGTLPFSQSSAGLCRPVAGQRGRALLMVAWLGWVGRRHDIH